MTDAKNRGLVVDVGAVGAQNTVPCSYNTQMIERAWKCARLKIIKNANNVHPNSLPGYLAEIWWRSMHKTASFNDFLAEVQKQYRMD